MTQISRDEAARTFLRRILEESYVATQKTLLSWLDGASPVTTDFSDISDLGSWYQALPEADRSRVRGVVHHTARSAVFGVLSLLDGVSAFERLDGHPGVFALYLEVFADVDAAFDQAPPVQRVHVNPIDPAGPLMHDLLDEAIEALRRGELGEGKGDG